MQQLTWWPSTADLVGIVSVGARPLVLGVELVGANWASEKSVADAISPIRTRSPPLDLPADWKVYGNGDPTGEVLGDGWTRRG